MIPSKALLFSLSLIDMVYCLGTEGETFFLAGTLHSVRRGQRQHEDDPADQACR